MKRSMINALALAVILAGIATTSLAGGIGVKANLMSQCGMCQCGFYAQCVMLAGGACACER